MARIIPGLLARETARLVTTMFLVTGLALPLAMIYLVQHALDTAAYRYGSYAAVATVEVFPDDLPRVRSELGQDVYLAATWELPVRHDGQELPVRARVTSTSGAGDHGWFVPEARVSGDPAGNVEDRWIDVSVELARALGLTVGDTVEVEPLPGAPVPLTVRGVYAVRLDGDTAVAQLPAAALAPLLPDPTLAYQDQLLTQTAPAQVSDILAAPFYRDRLREGGYTDVPDPLSREALLAERAQQSSAGLTLVLVTALLAGTTAVVFLVREATVFGQRCRPVLGLLASLGADPRRALATAAVLGVVGGGAGVLLGAVAGRLPYAAGVLGPGVPPYVEPVWWLATAIALLVPVVMVPAALRTTRRSR